MKCSVIVFLIGAFMAWYQPNQLSNSNYLQSFQKFVASYANVPYLHPILKHLVINDQVDKLVDSPTGTERVFTKEELSTFKGENDGPIYLALMGKVFDVTNGRDFYGPGGGYSFFTGKDGTRGFVSGDFTPAGLIDDISGLDDDDYLGVKNWIDFYAKDYAFIGKVEGKFYDSLGNPTEYLHLAEQWIAKAVDNKADKDKLKDKYPMCNVDYKPEVGSTVWCSKSSGGVKRDWVGFPRSLYSATDSKDVRCACVDEDNLNDPLVKEYPNCAKDSVSCKLSP